MTHQWIEAYVSQSLSLDRFAIVADLLEAKHEFTFSERNVVISIPKLSNDSPSGERVVECYLWKARGNIPVEYLVRRVDVRVDAEKKVRVPDEALQRPPNQTDLFTKAEQEHLNGSVRELAAIGVGAFLHWLKVLRWKSGIGHIGEPTVLYPGYTSGGAALRAASTGHRFWLQPYRVVAPWRKAVTLAHWEVTQAVLREAKTLPIWFDFLFDGEQRINNNDLIGAVLSIAVAFEVTVRTLVTHHLRNQQIEPLVFEVLDLANLRTILNRLKRLTFWDDSWKGITDFSQFNQLMDYRDRVMHSADTSALDGQKLKKLHATVKEFIYFASAHLDPT